jgi:hypothetical protein
MQPYDGVGDRQAEPRAHQITANLSVRTGGRLSVGASYVFSAARGDTSGATAFPSNPADLNADYGRMPFDVRHHLTLFMGIDGPGFRLVPTVLASSGQPFDIIVGQDLNGDSIFNDRPALATDPSRASVVRTPFGAFDAAPTAGQPIIPRNDGAGPPQLFVNLRAMKRSSSTSTTRSAWTSWSRICSTGRTSHRRSGR